jgi:hypothetical protein
MICLCSVLLIRATAESIEISLSQIESVGVNFSASQIEYSPDHDLLFLREGSTAIHIIEGATGQHIATQYPTEQFTDMDLTSDNKYFFAADYGGERMGYGNPINPHYVHRYDLEQRTWKIAQAPKIAWKIEAVSSDRVLLQEHDQHVDMTLNSFGDSMEELSRISADYYGDFEYDARTGRVYHGCSGSSSREIHVRRVVGDTLTSIGSSGTYGTAQNGGGTCVLSSDGFYFFYGALQVEAMDVRNNLHFYSERIYAASADIAFGENNYYYANTGAVLGSLGFSSKVYGVSEDGYHLWAFDASAGAVHHYQIGVGTEHRPIDLFVEGPAAVGYDDTVQFTAYALYDDGETVDVTSLCDWSIDRDIFGSIDDNGLLTTVNRPGDLIVSATYVEGRTLSASKSVQCIHGYGTSGVTEIEAFSLNTSVSQMEYAPEYGLLFLRVSGTYVKVVDVQTQQVIDTHESTEQFTDMDLTEDSRYLFAADYGDERTGYGTPINPHYVHRYDLEQRIWKISQAPTIAWKIEAVSADRVLLQEHDQHVDMMLNSFGDSMQELSRVGARYYGDFEYDPKTNRVYHGSSGSSSREIHVRKLEDDKLVVVGSSGTYGTAQGGGGTSILSTDGTYFYYGRLQVDAMNITNNLHVFTQSIYAASDKIAFGETRFFDAKSGEELSGLGFSTKIYAVSENGKHLWAFESDGDVLHHYEISSTDDNTPPVAYIDGEDRLVEAEGAWGATVSLDGSCSTDADSTAGTNDDIVAFNWYLKVGADDTVTLEPIGNDPIIYAELPIGEHRIVLEVIDNAETASTDEVTVIVRDTVAPQLEVNVLPATLWPPNNKMVKITPRFTATDNCDESPVVSIVSITMKEGDMTATYGDGDNDEMLIEEGEVYLRAKRSGQNESRVYTLQYQAVDDAGNSTTEEVIVTVPHDHRTKASSDSNSPSSDSELDKSNVRTRRTPRQRPSRGGTKPPRSRPARR